MRSARLVPGRGPVNAAHGVLARGPAAAMLPPMIDIAAPPAPAATALPEIRLQPERHKRVRGGHPWVFSNEVDTTATPLTAFAPGQIVQLSSDRGRFLGYAYVNPGTLISARLRQNDLAKLSFRAGRV